MRVDVTLRDIVHGERGRPGSCPVALAITRKVARGTFVSVGSSRLTLMLDWPYTKTQIAEIGLPGEAMTFIMDFDRGVAGQQPFSFDITVPEALCASK